MKGCRVLSNIRLRNKDTTLPQDNCLYINGLRLHYLDWGNNGCQTMLLLHGFMGHAHVWDNFAINFRSDYHIIALDQRGHGESEWSKEGAYAIEDYFVDLINFVETLGLRDLILIGHSMGGRNALFYAAYNYEKVARLVLIDARPGPSRQSSQALRHLLANLPLKAVSIAQVAQRIHTIYWYLSWKTCYDSASYAYKQLPNGTFVPKYDTRMSQQLEYGGYAAEELSHVMQNIACPTLIVRGEESPFLSRQEAKRMCEIIPKADLVEIPRSTHLPVQENKEAFNEAILAFLDN